MKKKKRKSSHLLGDAGFDVRSCTLDNLPNPFPDRAIVINVSAVLRKFYAALAEVQAEEAEAKNKKVKT